MRQKIGVVYGNPETTTGGNALKFYASVRLDIRKIGVVKNGEQPEGLASDYLKDTWPLGCSETKPTISIL